MRKPNTILYAAFLCAIALGWPAHANDPWDTQSAPAEIDPLCRDADAFRLVVGIKGDGPTEVIPGWIEEARVVQTALPDEIVDHLEAQIARLRQAVPTVVRHKADGKRGNFLFVGIEDGEAEFDKFENVYRALAATDEEIEGYRASLANLETFHLASKLDSYGNIQGIVVALNLRAGRKAQKKAVGLALLMGLGAMDLETIKTRLFGPGTTFSQEIGVDADEMKMIEMLYRLRREGEVCAE